MTSTTQQFPAEVPAGVSATTAALWPEAHKAYEAMVVSAKAIDDLKGTAGEILAKARATVIDSPEGKYVSDLVDSLKKAISEGEAWLEQQAKEAAASKMTGAEAKRKAAEAKYTEARNDFDAAIIFIGRDKKAAKVIATVSIPTAAKRASTGATRTNKAGLTYWRHVKGGVKENMGASQNQASSLAWYYGACLVHPDAKNGNMGALVQYASAKGVDVTASSAWSLELPNGTVIGCDKAEATPEA